MKDRQYYINKHKELYDQCLVEAGSENADDVTAGADTIYNEYATAEHIVGYYLSWYEEAALKTWEENLAYSKKRWEIEETEIDKEVTQILKGLFTQ